MTVDDEAPTVSIKAWDEFQHYRDRDPPWIKLYRDVLTSEHWLMGSDLSRLVQIALLLLAARHKNQIPLIPPMIRKAASLDCSDTELLQSLEFLSSSKFITIQGLNGQQSLFASSVLAKCYTEKSRGIQSRGTQSRDTSSSQTNVDGDVVRQIFEYWQSVWSKPRAKLDPKRHGVIKRALATYDPQSLKDSISGYRLSQFHLGQNDKNRTYDDIELFLRDAAHIDAGIAMTAQPINGKRRAKTIAELEAEENAKH